MGQNGTKVMAEWADRMQEWLLTGREVYAYFNNTDDGAPPSAIADARHLAEALRSKGLA